VLQEFFDGKPLREEAHREAVGRESEGIGEMFPESLGKSVEGGGLLEAGGFEPGPVKGGFLEEGGDVSFAEGSERGEAEAGSGKGLGETREAERGLHFGRGEENAGDVAIVAGAREIGRAGIVEDDVEDDPVKVLAFSVPVEVPVAGVEIEFDGSVMSFTVDLDGGGEEVRAGAAIPFAGGDDVDFLSVISGVVAGEVSGEPAGLDFDFIDSRREPGVGKMARGQG